MVREWEAESRDCTAEYRAGASFCRVESRKKAGSDPGFGTGRASLCGAEGRSGAVRSH